MRDEALAFWIREPGVGEIRPVALPDPGPERGARPRAAFGVSRGTEALVFEGRVPRASTPPCARRSRRATSPGR